MGNINQLLTSLHKAMLDSQRGNQIANQEAEDLLDQIFTEIGKSEKNYNQLLFSLCILFEKLESRHANLLLIFFLTVRSSRVQFSKYKFQSHFSLQKPEPDFEKKAEANINRFITDSVSKKWKFRKRNLIYKIDKSEAKQWLSYIEKYLKNFYGIRYWKSDRCVDLAFRLDLHGEISRSINDSESFYVQCSLFLPKLIESEHYHIFSSISEDIISSSFEDKLPEFGFLSLARGYKAQGDVLRCLVFLSLVITTISIKESVSEYLYYQFYLTFMEIVGSMKSSHIKIIYNEINRLFQLDEYQQANLNYIYYDMLINLELADNYSLNTLLSYIENEVLKSLAKTEVPYIILLKEIQFYNSSFDLRTSSLLAAFSGRIGEDEFNKIISLFKVPDISILINGVKNLLFQVQKVKDQPYQIEAILGSKENFISTLHHRAVNENNNNAYLIAMILKTDYKLSCNNPIAEFESYYEYLKSNLNINSAEIFFLSVESVKLFSLSVAKNNFGNITEIENWHYEKITNWITQLKSYATGEKKAANTQEIVNIFAGIPIKNTLTESTKIYLIKDLYLSSIPHNLLTNEKNEFVSLTKPVIDVISTDWLLNHQTDNLRAFSIEAYIPIEDGDQIIKSVFDNEKMKKTIKENSIKVHTSRFPLEKLSSTINVFIAHGNSNITDHFSLFTGEYELYNMDKIVGLGQIAILFICNAGAQKKADYTHKMASFIRYFIQKGYETVIAPAWELKAELPPIWLGFFLEKMKSGSNVLQSFHSANLKLHAIKNFQSPTDWACLHIYGNPHLRFK
jgi:hypothetical protein